MKRHLSYDTSILCQNIRLLRERNGLSRRKMASIMHIGVPTLDKIEQGVLPPSMRVNSILHLCASFDITPNKLFHPLP